MPINVVNARTVREYLKALLASFWKERSNFNPIRPMGTRLWLMPLEEALVRGGLVRGVIDEDGDPRVFDHDEFNGLIASAIEAL